MKKELESFKNIVTVKTKYDYVSRFNGMDCTFYCFEDAEKNMYVFNTSSPLTAGTEKLDRGDEVLIAAKIKSVGEYKGQP